MKRTDVRAVIPGTRNEWHHPVCRARDPREDDYKGPQWHKVRLACDAGSGHGGIRICSDACSGAQSTAICP